MSVFEKYLTDDEEVLYKIKTRMITEIGFTNKRIISLKPTGLINKKENFKDISYAHISSIIAGYKNYYWLLWIGPLILLIGLLSYLISGYYNPMDILSKSGFVIMGTGGSVFVIGFLIREFLRDLQITFVTCNEEYTINLKGSSMEQAHTINEIIRENSE
ncbi:MAG: PH domain-containing protein [Methanohalobium sp.]|uniref:PH domain-containing protein n=1 Tax=Methanohalobium sp. TaxID=2837493 RepID=UPI0039794C93